MSCIQWYGLSRPNLYIQCLPNQLQRGKLFYGTPGTYVLCMVDTVQTQTYVQTFVDSFKATLNKSEALSVRSGLSPLSQYCSFGPQAREHRLCGQEHLPDQGGGFRVGQEVGRGPGDLHHAGHSRLCFSRGMTRTFLNLVT